jgi:hypothetical protein
VDRQNPAIEKDILVGESQDLLIHLRKKMRMRLTKKIERLRFALMPAGLKPRAKANAGGKSRTWECWL